MTGVDISYVAIFGFALVAIGYIDFKKGIVPDAIVYPAAALALFFNGFYTDMGIINCLLGGAVGLGVVVFMLLLNHLVAQKTAIMGGGDIKLIILIGLITGYPIVAAVLVIGGFSGLLISGILLIARRKKRASEFAMAPCFCLIAFSWLIMTLVI